MESVNVIQEDILINIEIIENLYKNSKLVNIMLKEFSNPTLLEEHVVQENFVDIMCRNYTDEQIIGQLYKTNLIKKTYRYKNHKSIYYSTKSQRKLRNSFKWINKYNKWRKKICKCKKWNNKI